jgi:hypothetical protein
MNECTWEELKHNGRFVSERWNHSAVLFDNSACSSKFGNNLTKNCGCLEGRLMKATMTVYLFGI